MSSSVGSRDEILDLIARRRDGWAMPGGFYAHPGVYDADMEYLFRQQWVFVGHSCQVKNPGDFFTVTIGNDPLILMRGDDGQLRALYNVCRHRGTLLCWDDCGHTRRLTCPYHQWSYERDGSLASCRGMHDQVQDQQLDLLQAQLQELEGMLFVCLAESPPDFTAASELIGPVAAPQRMADAKVAKIVDYEIAANWKLVWENNRECYHCNVNHPQYIKANFDHFNQDDTTEQVQERIDQQTRRSEEKWQHQGLAASHRSTGMALFPDADQDLWYSANRTVLVEGYISESMDGQQVAPLMGDYPDPDVGTLRIRTMPNFWNHSSCDHVVSTRLLPTGPGSTQARVYWLVHPDAEEGKDYQLETLMPFWQLTSEQDWELCEFAQRGVQSNGYRPGPLSIHKEYNVDGFIRWYLQQLKRGLTEDRSG